MNTASKILQWMFLCSASAGFIGPRPAAAQEPAAAPAPRADTQSSHTAQSEAGEPRAATSSAAAATTATSPAAAPAAGMPAAGAAPAAGAPKSAGASPPLKGPAASAAAPGSASPGPAARPAGKARDPKSAAADRLELGAATVTGDREQPKVMYIVPWKKSDIGDLSGKPMNSLLDEALAPVDRDEFKREVVYYQAVKADASQNGASRAPAQQGEK